MVVWDGELRQCSAQRKKEKGNDLFRDADGNYRGYDLLSVIATIRPYQTKLLHIEAETKETPFRRRHF